MTRSLNDVKRSVVIFVELKKSFIESLKADDDLRKSMHSHNSMSLETGSIFLALLLRLVGARAQQG